MPDAALLNEYEPVHAAMRVATTDPAPPIDDFPSDINELDELERALEALEEDEEPLVAVDLDTDEVDTAGSFGSGEPETDYTELVKQAFLAAVEKNGTVAVIQKLKATLTNVDRVDDFVAGVLMGVPTGVIKDIVDQVTWLLSLLSDIVGAMPKAASSAGQTVSEIVDWVSDPDLWLAARDLYLARTPDEFVRALERLRDQLPAWVISVAEVIQQLYETAEQIPDMLKDEEFKRGLLVTGAEALATTTESLAQQLDNAGDDPKLQGEVVGVLIGAVFSFALLSLLLGAVRLPAKVGAKAIEAGVDIAKGFAGAASAAGNVASRHARATGDALAVVIARLRRLLEEVLKKRSRIPAPRRPRFDPNSPAVLKRAAKLGRGVLSRFSNKVATYGDLKLRAVEPFNKLTKVTNAKLKKSARAAQKLLMQVQAHHVIEKKWIRVFTRAQRERLGWIERTIDGQKWKPSDSMPAVLIFAEGHSGIKAFLRAQGRRRGSRSSKAPGLLRRKKRGAKESLPSYNELDEFMNNVKPRNAQEVLDAHERWYVERFMNPRGPLFRPDQISRPWPKLPDKLRATNLAQIKLMVDALNDVRRTLDLPLSNVLSTL